MLAHAKDDVVVSLRPSAGLEKQDGQGEWQRACGVPRGVEPVNPVLCFDSGVVEARSVNDVEVVRHSHLRHLSDAFDGPFRRENVLSGQPIEKV